MWEWFLPFSERHKYQSQIMEGPHGGSGEPMTLGGKVIFVVVMVVALAILVVGITWLKP